MRTRRTPTHPRSTARSSSPYLDPYAVSGTLTLAEYRRARAAVPAVHVVLPLEDTTQPAA
jgi:hypothetical protein